MSSHLEIAQLFLSAERARAAYNNVAPYYDSCFKSKTAKAEDQIIYGDLKKFLRTSSVLDLGCGTGAFLEYCKLERQNYVGVDISEKMLEEAKHKFPNHVFYWGDMVNLPFPDESFDNVISLFGGISYADPKVFEEVLRLLKPGGRYFLMLFNSRYARRTTYILNRYKITAPFYPFKDVENSLPSHCKKVGFNFHGDVFNFLPTKLIKLILRAEKKLLGKLLKSKAFFCIVYGEKP